MKSWTIVVLIAALMFTAGCKKKETAPEPPISVNAATPAAAPAVAKAPVPVPTARPVAVPVEPIAMAEMFTHTNGAPTARAWCINGTVWLTAGNDWVQMFERGDNGAEPVACSGGIVFNVPK